MPSPADHDPLCPTDQEPSAATPARDVTTDAVPPSSVVEGSTVPYVPGAAATPTYTEPERGQASVSVPGYDILGVLGRGGMGVVLKARQVRADRVVALKVIKATVDDDELRRRFRTEAQALARIKHTNIVQIYDVG